MNLLLISISFLVAALNSANVQAQTVLVPDQTISIDQYISKCKMEGYLCTQSFLANEEVQKPTVLFDQLIDSIDLSNKLFVDGLPKAIQNILQKEMISFEQLEMMTRLLEQTQDPQKESKSVRQLTDELKYIQTANSPEKNFNVMTEKFIIFFKKPISVEAFNRLKKSYLNLPYVEVSFNQLPLMKNLKSKSSQSEFLVTGSCESANLNSELKISTWKIMSEKSCGWSESITKSTSGFTGVIKENKGWILTGALILGAAVLASKYDVKFQF